MVNSELLHLSCSALKALHAEANQYQQPSLHNLSVRTKIYRQSNCTIIAFVTSPICTTHHLQQGADLVSSATFNGQNPTPFDFLRSINDPAFSIHRAAIEHFASLFKELCQLKTQVPSFLLFFYHVCVYQCCRNLSHKVCLSGSKPFPIKYL